MNALTQLRRIIDGDADVGDFSFRERESMLAAISSVDALTTALRDLYTECDANQHEELAEHPTWGPIMRAAEHALAQADQQEGR